jgi:hypothetical protein
VRVETHALGVNRPRTSQLVGSREEGDGHHGQSPVGAHALHAQQDVPLKPRTRTTASHGDEDEYRHATVCAAALRRANSLEWLIPNFHEEPFFRACALERLSS